MGSLECVEGLAEVAIEEGQPGPATWLFGLAERQREAIGTPMAVGRRAAYEREVQALHAALVEEAFTAAWAAGLAVPLERVLVEFVRV
ncbi:MAG TPA: hypothetical protein VGS80_22355 [Ktedonobacterales bacterium]|nr:hypothetical protein [Ktedonobacterales bacterium]